MSERERWLMGKLAEALTMLEVLTDPNATDAERVFVNASVGPFLASIEVDD